MRTLRISLWSIVGVILFTAVAWSFSVLFFQIASTSAARAEMQLRANLNPMHIGYQGEAVSPAKPGIPLQANSSQKVGGRDLAEWLQPSLEAKGEIQGCGALSAIVDDDAVRFRVVRLSNDLTDKVFPASELSGHVIVLIAIPLDDSNSGVPMRWGKNAEATDSGDYRPIAIPAFGMSGARE